MNIKPDDKLAIWISRDVIVEVLHMAAMGEVDTSIDGTRFSVTSQSPSWKVRMLGAPQPSIVAGSHGFLFQERCVRDSMLRPIRDQPGNEKFVVEARKTLERAKPVTGPVTIDNRGEVVR